MFTCNFLSFNERFFSDASSEDDGIQSGQGNSEGRHRLGNVVTEHLHCQLRQVVSSQVLFLQISGWGAEIPLNITNQIGGL